MLKIVFSIFRLLLMQQSGIVERLYREHDIRTRLTCFESDHLKLTKLDFYDTAFPFFLLCSLAILTIGILLCEKIIRKFWKFEKKRSGDIFQGVRKMWLN